VCTVVYRRTTTELVVAMNRDERWGRAPETAPTLHRDSRRWLAPGDGEKGGTWIGVDEHGRAACLLNGYAPGDLGLLGKPGVPSRGDIIPRLLSAPPSPVDAWIRDRLQPWQYPSFTLLVWGVEAGRRITWRLDRGFGVERLPEGEWGLETSSLWRTDEVLAWRRSRFESWLREGAPRSGRLPAFNLLEDPERRAWSPFMTRPMSATRSVTLVELDAERGTAELAWWPRPGDGSIAPDAPAAALRLETTLATAE
jgi:hypothetical protein